MKRSDIERQADQAASEFRYKRSPMSGTNRLSVVEATALRDSEHGMAIVLKADGRTIRTTKTDFASGSHIDFNIELKEGETLLALVHSHPPGATGSRFSTGDIQTANRADIRANIYLLQPFDEQYGYGVIVYDVKRNKIYDLP